MTAQSSFDPGRGSSSDPFQPNPPSLEDVLDSTLQRTTAMSPRLPRTWAFAIAAIAFLVRAAVAVQLGRTALFERPQLDSFEFLLWGNGIAHGALFHWLAPTHGPGYPFFLGLLLALTGGSLPLVRLAQAALGAGLCVLAAALGARFFEDRRAGLAAGLLLAFYGPLVYVEVSFLAEGLFVFLLTLALWTVAVRGEVSGRTGLLLGLATATRATALPLMPVFAALAWLRRRPRAAAWMALAWLAVVAPVLVFLRATRGSWIPVQAFGGLNLYMGNRIGASGTPTARLGGDWDLLHYEPQRLGIEDDAARERYYTKKVLGEIARQPLGFAAGLGRKALWLLQDDEIRESHSLYFFRERSSALRLLPGFGLLFPLSAWGLWLARRRLPAEAVAYLAAMAVSCVAIIVSSRYRLPLVPLLAASAGGAAVWAFDRLRARRWRELAPAAAVLALAALVPHVRDHAPSRNLAEEWALTASSLQSLGRLEEARRAVERALAADPGSALAWLQEGRLRLAARDAAGAERAFREAARRGPNYQRAHLELGMLYRRKGEPAEAERALRRSLWLVPDDPATLAELAGLLAARAASDTAAGGEAAGLLRRLLAIDPSNGAAWTMLAGIAGSERALAFAGDLLGPGHPLLPRLRARFERRGAR